MYLCIESGVSISFVEWNVFFELPSWKCRHDLTVKLWISRISIARSFTVCARIKISTRDIEG